MQYITDINKLNIDTNLALTIGKFDGLHRGHLSLVEDIVSYKEQHPEIKTAMLTFSGISNLFLTSSLERRYLADKQGLDYLIELPFDSKMQHTSADNFVFELLIKKLKMKYLSVGSDFKFGLNRQGDAEFLEKASLKYNFDLNIHSKLKYHNHDISSSYIKDSISNFDLINANKMLGYDYFILGEVVHGNKIGSTILGFPTINVNPAKNKLLPPNGVYISKIELCSRTYHSISNIGTKPTISDNNDVNIESFVLDGNVDCYGLNVMISLIKFVRAEKKFANMNELKAEITDNIRTAREYFNLNKTVNLI